MSRGVAGAAVFVLLVALGACSDDDADDPGGAEPVGEVVGEGDTYEAQIRRTDGAVPHIRGDSIADVTFGQGWASGEDRTCDLIDQVLKVRGERAAWFGPGEDDANVDSDFAWRSIGIWDRAQREWDGTDGPSEDVRTLLSAFTAGWNGHLDAVGADNVAGWCAGEDFVRPIEPVELYAYARSVALFASSAHPVLNQAIAEAQPPAPAVAPAGMAGDPIAAFAALAGEPDAPTLASNGWAIGAERSAATGCGDGDAGCGMLLANPHFPWVGELRFWEVHLTVPGEVDAYGVQLSGLPGIGIGFTENFGWTHTVSAGHRFTAYRLNLVPGSPTTYHYGDEQRQMTSTDVTVEVLGEDGTRQPVTRTMWSSHYGPILSVPSFGVTWTAETALTFRDANIDNDEFLDQYYAMQTAQDFDAFVAAHETHAGIPLFNTIAVSRDGRAWYGDFSATPNLSDAGLAAYEQLKADDFLVRAAEGQGLVLLDGSNPVFEWEDAEGARDPGLVPIAELPRVERDDYVFNANDSFWMPHGTELLEGDYSFLHGEQRTPRSLRTRENAAVLDDTSSSSPAGEDGAFDLGELADAALLNEGFPARELLDAVVERCEAGPEVTVAVLPDAEGGEALPAGTVDLTEACTVLGEWDGIYDLDRSGPPIWREMLYQFSNDDLADAGSLWAEPFDPAQPLATPSGLAPVPAGATDPVLENLARAVQILEAADIPLDATLGDVQVAPRGEGHEVPIHGGDGVDGTTNVVTVGGFELSTSVDPEIQELEPAGIAPGSGLYDLDGEARYPVDFGTSFLLALAFEADGPVAKAFLTYGNVEDREGPLFVEATERFSAKRWRDVAFTAADVRADTESILTVRG